MIFEIIAILLVIDSLIALLLGYTKLGDETIEQSWFFRRYFPLTKGWALAYFALSLYIAYLTFVVIV